MVLKRNFLLWVAVVSLAVATAVILWVAAFWYQMSAAEEALFVHVLFERFAGIFLTAFFLMAALAIVFGILLHHYLIPLRRLAEETTVIATVNPSHRISLKGARDILQLVQAINDGANRFQRLQASLDEKIRHANADLAMERNMLAAIIARLEEGIVVCNRDFHILMYNARAKELLSITTHGPAEASRSSHFIGVGRSLLEILDAEMIKNAAEALNGKEAKKDVPLALFAVRQNGRKLTIHMGILPRKEEGLSGYFFSLREAFSVKEMPPENLRKTDSVQFRSVPSSMLSNFRPTCDMRDILESAIPSEENLPSRPEFFDFKLFKQVGKSPDMEKMPLKELAYTAFDTETTGLYPSMGDEIISIGAVPILKGKMIREEAFYEMVDPKRIIRPEAVQVHGITHEMVKGRPTIEKVIPRFHKFVEGSVLVAHNAAFDMRFLELKEPKTGFRFDNPVLDTLLLSLVIHPQQPSHNLAALARFMGIEVKDRHTALGDAFLVGEIFVRFIPLLKRSGIHTLEEALTACMETSLSQLQY